MVLIRVGDVYIQIDKKYLYLLKGKLFILQNVSNQCSNTHFDSTLSFTSITIHTFYQTTVLLLQAGCLIYLFIYLLFNELQTAQSNQLLLQKINYISFLFLQSTVSRTKQWTCGSFFNISFPLRHFSKSTGDYGTLVVTSSNFPFT